MKGRLVRRVQVIGLLAAMWIAIAVSAHFRPDRSALAHRFASADQPVQSNGPELTAPTPGFDPKHLQEALEAQADCTKAGQNTKYGTNAELCGMPNNSAIPPAGADISASDNYSQAIGTDRDLGGGITNPPTAPPKTGFATGDPYSPIPRHHGKFRFWESPLTIACAIEVLVLVLLTKLYNYASGTKFPHPPPRHPNNETVPTAEPK